MWLTIFGFCTIPTVLHWPQALTVFIYFTLHTITTEVNRCACGCMCVNVCALCACACVYALCELHMELCQLYAHFHVLNSTQLQYTTPIGIVWITYLTIKQLSIFISDCLHHIARCGSLCSNNWSVISWWPTDLCGQIFHTMTTM